MRPRGMKPLMCSAGPLCEDDIGLRFKIEHNARCLLEPLRQPCAGGIGFFGHIQPKISGQIGLHLRSQKAVL